MFDPDADPITGLPAGADSGLGPDELAPEPTPEQLAFVAALDAAELAALNAPPAPIEPLAVTDELARRAHTSEALTRRAQAAMLRDVHALAGQVLVEDTAYAGGIRHEGEEFAADEVAVALGVPRHTARDRIDDAYALVEASPRILALLEAGVLSYQAATLLATESGYAPEGMRGEAQTRILDRLAGSDLPGLGSMSVEAITQVAVLDPDACWRVAVGATPARVRRLARRVLADLDATTPARRRRRQPAPSDIVAYPTRPGWMLLGLELTEADGCTAQARLHGHARLLKRQPGETRSMGELRWQALHDLIFGHTPPEAPDSGSDGGPDGPSGSGGSGGPGDGSPLSPYDGLVGRDPGQPVRTAGGLPVPVPFDVHLTIDATGTPAAPRYGELSPDTLQQIMDAARASGGQVHVQPITPKPCPGTHPHPKTLGVDPDPRFPTTSQAAAVRMRDKVCQFPGCSIPAGRCDLDHTLPWPHGPTCRCNLCCLCRHHHRLKTHGRWKVVNHGDGHLTWTTPTGRTIHTRPDP